LPLPCRILLLGNYCTYSLLLLLRFSSAVICNRFHLRCSYNGRRLNATRDVTRLLGFNEGKEAVVTFAPPHSDVIKLVDCFVVDNGGA
jgi:hypothetical protein